MPSPEEKSRRKQLLDTERNEQQQRAQASFPAPAIVLKNLFDFIDEQLSSGECDDTLRYTRMFIQQNNLEEAGFVQWLHDKGGYCDCEVLNNVEEYVAEAVPGFDVLGQQPS